MKKIKDYVTDLCNDRIKEIEDNVNDISANKDNI